ncbi:MAG: SRPBCC family protein [Candidatus Cyclonatronum sp.]|uniref:SRPBCC family protein n=1 Tax=Cyclonatronum sp. TaxID=3024185 RepID=UPI0025BB909C|nr:SRPBCC family protein [Cyclonatronum sp.]MCC5934720.1 SRPBCC family protein [Balneolales bacterium]MCH8486825.1 SRPBCC family protein [Cyclonatronum sp.]
MSFTTFVELNRTFEVSWAPEQVFELLADVPKSVAHFPKVDKLIDLGDNAYRWEMEKIGVQMYNIQAIHACKYTSYPGMKTVKWEPVKGVGNGVVSGSWKLDDAEGGGTVVKFHIKATLETDLPFFVKMAVSPIVAGEFESMIDTYHKNLQETMNAPG